MWFKSLTGVTRVLLQFVGFGLIGGFVAVVIVFVYVLKLQEHARLTENFRHGYCDGHAARLEVDQADHPVVSPVDGQVVEVYMTLGADVEPGTLLFELDAVPLSLQREEEQARGEGLDAQLAALRREIAAEEQALADAREVARSAFHDILSWIGFVTAEIT